MRKLAVGIRLLSRYAIVGLLVNILLTIFFIVLLKSFSTSFIILFNVTSIPSLYIFIMLIMLLGLIIIAFYRYLIPAFDKFVDHNSKYRSVSTLLRIAGSILVVSLLFLTLVLYVALLSPQASIFFMVSILVVVIVNIFSSCMLIIGLSIGFLRLSKDLNERLFLYVAIVGIIGLLSSLFYCPTCIALAYVYYVLLCLACRSALRRIDRD
ncbi:MAG: hypothetical protein GXO26_00045 [Crenarchaeota archaeon]|nr:hypothetical protein [Thermoproteota archaeon]